MKPIRSLIRPLKFCITLHNTLKYDIQTRLVLFPTFMIICRIHRVLIMRLIVNTVQLHVSTCPPSSGTFRSFHSPSCHTHEPTAARLHNSETNMGDENRSINVQSFGLHSYFCPYEFIKSRPLLLQVMPYLTSSLKDCLVCGETVRS